MEDRQQVIDNINHAWPKDLIIRALYVRLAPFFERDLKFFFSDDQAQLEYVRTLSRTVDRKVICLSLCQFYQDVFEMFDINSKVVPTNQKLVPHYALIVEGDSGQYLIDPLKDLMNNQAGLRTEYYGIIPKRQKSNLLRNNPCLMELPLEYRNEMDQFLGLYPNNLLNEYLEKLHLELTTNKAYIYLGNYLHQNLEKFDRKTLYKMKMLFLNQCLINLANIPGKIERAQYYNCLLCHVLNHSERGKAITRCGEEIPILVRIHDTIYIDEVVDKGRILRLEPNPSSEVKEFLNEAPRFRLK
ncbi:MAG: hypothetical protein NC483_02755 [Ruminococcus sp.]|nr:hypothetical protein [Ruminococcus sp.]